MKAKLKERDGTSEHLLVEFVDNYHIFFYYYSVCFCLVLLNYYYLYFIITIVK